MPEEKSILKHIANKTGELVEKVGNIVIAFEWWENVVSFSYELGEDLLANYLRKSSISVLKKWADDNAKWDNGYSVAVPIEGNTVTFYIDGNHGRKFREEYEGEFKFPQKR